MFYLSDDKMVIKDFFGSKVGYFVDGKFCQVFRKKNNKAELCDEPYLNGLSPMELEQISELLQRSTSK
jgi:hypothetical protein